MFTCRQEVAYLMSFPSSIPVRCHRISRWVSRDDSCLLRVFHLIRRFFFFFLIRCWNTEYGWKKGSSCRLICVHLLVVIGCVIWLMIVVSVCNIYPWSYCLKSVDWSVTFGNIEVTVGVDRVIFWFIFKSVYSGWWGTSTTMRFLNVNFGTG